MSPSLDLSEAGIREFCRQYLSKVLKLPPGSIADDASFSAIGLDSAESVFLVSALCDWSGLDLPAETAMDHPSLDQLSGFIVAQVPPAVK
jgi:acyl carrier protein